MFSIRGKKVLITGAAQGLGRELCIQFKNRGAEVIANDLNAEALLRLKSECGHGIYPVVGDITDSASLRTIKEKVDHIFSGQLDVLVNNAGIVSGGPFLDIDADAHLRTIDVNLKSLIRMTHLFLPYLLQSKESCLLQIGSVTGMMGLAFGTSYASSKWGVLGFSESLRQELRHLGHKNLHICVVCPSYIATGMFEGSRAPKFMPFLKTSELAEKIIRAVEARKHSVKEPFLVKTVPLIRGLFPLKWQDAVLDFLGVSEGMSHWKGRSKDLSTKQQQNQ